MSQKNAKPNTVPMSPDVLSEKELALLDATTGFRAMVSNLKRAGVTVHLGYDNGTKDPVARDKAGNFAITISGAHIESGQDGPVLVADKKAEPVNEKTPE